MPPARSASRFNGARHWGGKGTTRHFEALAGPAASFNGARHWGGKGTAGHARRGPPVRGASMGPATGAGKGPVNGKAGPLMPQGFNGARHWGGKGTPHSRAGTAPRSGASMGPATGAGKGLRWHLRRRNALRLRFNGARHWGGKGTRPAHPPASSLPSRFNGARHWGGKGTDGCRVGWADDAELQWGPPLGRERDRAAARSSRRIS